MAKHRIAVLSDTHGLLRQEVKEILRGCEVILHGGDINSPEIVDQMNIYRMYSTHPGVTVGGIIDKLELRKIYRK